MSEVQRDLLDLALGLEQQGKMRRVGNAFIFVEQPETPEIKEERERGWQEFRRNYNATFLRLQAEQRREQRRRQIELKDYRVTF